MKMGLFAKMGELIKLFFVWLHTSGFEMMKWAIEDFQRNRIGGAVLQIFCGIVLILFALFIDLLAIYCIYRLLRFISIMLKTKKVKRYNVAGIIRSKSHKNSYMSTMYTGKMLIPVYHDEEYNVCVEYDGITEVFNSKTMFNKYKKGDSISIILVESLDKNDVVIERTLELPE